MTTELPSDLVERVLSSHPLPVADAVAWLESSSSLHERRDRVVEVFRAIVRFLAAVTLAARVQYGPGPGEDADTVGQLKRQLWQRGLTDGQWVGLIRELQRPWSATPDGYALPAVLALFRDRHAKVSETLSALLGMRKAETVAHGPTGDEAGIEELLTRRVPQLQALLEGFDPLWKELHLVVPLMQAQEGDQVQVAWRLMGMTPGRGRWRRVGLAPGVRLPPGNPVLVDSGGRALLALHPICLFRKPSPELAEEVFVLDGLKPGSASYVALPSMAEHRESDAWKVLERALAGLAEKTSEGLEQDRPYRGLEAFGPQDAELFHGREQLSESLANRIRRHAWVTVTGPSGGGKTSLLMAGVSPLLADFLPVLLRPGSNPVSSLLRKLKEVLSSEEDPPTAELVAVPGEPSFYAQVAARCHATHRRLVVIVDQAEELFTLAADLRERESFARGLADLASEADGPVRVVVSLREDFFGRLATLEPIRALAARQVEVVGTPDREALVRTLTLPLERSGYTFEDAALVDTMVDTVAGEPASLALLQACAERLWEARDRSWKRLTWKSYRAIGGVEGALASRAEETIAGFTPAQQSEVRAMFLRLVTKDGTRAVVSRTVLEQATRHPEDAAIVLQRLVDARLLVARESVKGGAAADVELVHEALIGHWERLKTWVEEDRDGRRMLQTLRAAAAEWEQRGRSSDLLWRRGMLSEYRRWRARSNEGLTDVEAAFASASVAAERRASRVKRTAYAAGLAVAVGFGLAMFGQWRVAESAREDAQASDRSAHSGLAEAALERAGRFATGRRMLDARLEAAASVATNPADPENRLYDETWVQKNLKSRDLLAAARSWIFQTRAEGPMAAAIGFPLGPDVTDFSLPPDGRLAVVLRKSGDAELWSMDDGRRIKVLSDGEGPEKSLDAVFSPDGNRIATALATGVHLWTPTGDPLGVLPGTEGLSIASIEWAGDRIVVLSNRGILLFDAASWLPVELPVAARSGWPGALTADGRRLAIAGRDDVIRVYTLSGGERDLVGHTGFLTGVAFSPDGTRLASSAIDSTARLWDVETGQMLAVLPHDDEALDVAFSADGRLLASAGYDRLLRVWDTASGSLLFVLPAYHTPLRKVAAWRQGFVGMSEDEIRTWDRLGTPVVFRTADQDFVWSVVPSADGKTLATSGKDGVIRLWDAADGRLDVELHGHVDVVHEVAFSPDGTQLASAGIDGTIRLWDVSTGKAIRTLDQLLSSSVSYAPDGRLAGGTTDGRLRTYRSDGEIAATWSAHTDIIFRVRFSSDGAWLASVAGDGMVRIWDAPDHELHSWKLDHRASTLAVARDAPVLVAASQGGEILTVNTQSWTSSEVVIPGRTFTQIQLSADGKILATATDEGFISLWHTGEAEPFLTITQPRVSFALALTPDGRRLYAGDNNIVRTYDIDLSDMDADSNQLLKEAEAAAGRERPLE
jgi:WD40 repeat protein